MIRDILESAAQVLRNTGRFQQVEIGYGRPLTAYPSARLAIGDYRLEAKGIGQRELRAPLKVRIFSGKVSYVDAIAEIYELVAVVDEVLRSTRTLQGTITRFEPVTEVQHGFVEEEFSEEEVLAGEVTIEVIKYPVKVGG